MYIKSKKDLREFLDYESKRYGLSSSKFPMVAIHDVAVLYRFNYLLRHLEYYTNTKKPIRRLITKLRYKRIKRKYLIDLPTNVFDKGLKLMHIGPILVNQKAIVGKDCALHINTGIVAGGTNDDVPVIGDNCVLGIGSIVLGHARLGNNIAVGAGAVVNKDFSEGNMTIGGVPAKKISDNTRESWYKEARDKANKEWAKHN